MEETLEWFKPTSGRITGVLARPRGRPWLVVLAVLDRDQAHALPLALGAVFVGVIAWATMLRPGLAVSPTTLVLRNMLETVHVPLAAIEEMVVRQVLAVRAGGPSLRLAGDREVLAQGADRGQGGGRAEPGPPSRRSSRSYADFVEARVRHRATRPAPVRGCAVGSPEQLAPGPPTYVGSRRGWRSACCR